MARTKKRAAKKQPVESDSTYILKLVMYLIVGSLWIKITTADGGQIPIPAGLILGFFFAAHDHFAIDRKIEYALILVAMFIGFWLPIGIFITL